MRLAQLARKLEISPAQIVDFLAKKNILIASGSNTKIEPDHVTMVIQNFAPALLETAPEVAPEVTQPEEPVMVLEHTAPAPVEEIVAVTPEVPTENDTDAPLVKADTPEVIKAPKVELSGLKVLGKIELPEVKKKASQTDVDQQAEGNEEIGKSFTPRKQKDNPSTQRIQRPRRNPIALQREREAQEAERKREELLKREKEKKMLYYQNRVKPPQPNKAAKLFKDEVVEMSAKELEEAPKTWWGKFMKWLTT